MFFSARGCGLILGEVLAHMVYSFGGDEGCVGSGFEEGFERVLPKGPRFFLVRVGMGWFLGRSLLTECALDNGNQSCKRKTE